MPREGRQLGPRQEAEGNDVEQAIEQCVAAAVVLRRGVADVRAWQEPVKQEHRESVHGGPRDGIGVDAVLRLQDTGVDQAVKRVDQQVKGVPSGGKAGGWVPATGAMFSARNSPGSVTAKAT